MAITKLQFHDQFRGWKLNEVSFSSFNLLVGMSGVGKTRILEALKSVRSAATRGVRRANGCIWQLEIEAEGEKYIWSAETSLVTKVPLFEVSGDSKQDEDANSPVFLTERITRGTQEVLVDRTRDSFIFNGSRLPKLKNSESAISLLRDEESIAPLNKAIRRVIFSKAPDVSQASISFVPYDDTVYQSIRQRYQTLEALREASDVHIFMKGYILQQDYPQEFARIKNDYQEIFPSVCDVKLDKLTELDPSFSDEGVFSFSLLSVAIKEAGIKNWITSPRLSSGMLRTLIHLFELAMAPMGTVIVIDEFENSLGVNCLQPLTDRLMERSRDLQFILTSHHPYIISNIPSKHWRIVTRKGSVITVLNEGQVPALRTNSAQDKFIQLLNSAEYEEGIR